MKLSAAVESVEQGLEAELETVPGSGRVLGGGRRVERARSRGNSVATSLAFAMACRSVAIRVAATRHSVSVGSGSVNGSDENGAVVGVDLAGRLFTRV